MQPLPDSVAVYKQTAVFDETTVPKGLLRRHSTAAGVWGRIVVLDGELVYRVLEPTVEEVVLTSDRFGVAAPEQPHEVEPRGPVRFRVEFLR